MKKVRIYKEGGSTAPQNMGVNEIGFNKLNTFKNILAKNTRQALFDAVENEPIFQSGGGFSPEMYGYNPNQVQQYTDALTKANEQMGTNLESFGNMFTNIGDVFNPDKFNKVTVREKVNPLYANEFTKSEVNTNRILNRFQDGSQFNYPVNPTLGYYNPSLAMLGRTPMGNAAVWNGKSPQQNYIQNGYVQPLYGEYLNPVISNETPLNYGVPQMFDMTKYFPNANVPAKNDSTNVAEKAQNALSGKSGKGTVGKGTANNKQPEYYDPKKDNTQQGSDNSSTTTTTQSKTDSKSNQLPTINGVPYGLTGFKAETRRAWNPKNRLKSFTMTFGIPGGNQQIQKESIPNSGYSPEQMAILTGDFNPQPVAAASYNVDWNPNQANLKFQNGNEVIAPDWNTPWGNAEDKLRVKTSMGKDWQSIGKHMFAPTVDGLTAFGNMITEPNRADDLINRTSADQVFNPYTDGDRGFNPFNLVGVVSPNKHTPVQFAGFARGGAFEVGKEYEMSDEELRAFLACGGQVKMID